MRQRHMSTEEVFVHFIIDGTISGYVSLDTLLFDFQDVKKKEF